MALADTLKAAYESGDYATANQLLAANGLTASAVQQMYGLDAATMTDIQNHGIVFSDGAVHGTNLPVTPPRSHQDGPPPRPPHAPRVAAASAPGAPVAVAAAAAPMGAGVTAMLSNPTVLLALAAVAAVLLLRK